MYFMHSCKKKIVKIKKKDNLMEYFTSRHFFFHNVNFYKIYFYWCVSSFIISWIVWASIFENMFFYSEFAFKFFTTERTYRCQFFRTFFLVFILFINENDIKTTLTIFELIFQCAILQVMLKQLWNLNNTWAIFAWREHFTLFIAMNVIHILVLKL